MSRKLEAILIAAACLVCCLPLLLTLAGATTGIAGAVGVWLGRHNLTIIGAALGPALVMAMALRRHQSAPAP